MRLVSPGIFAKFKKALRDAHDTFNQEEIILKRRTMGLSRFGGEPKSTYEIITLKGLMDFNYFRKWATDFSQFSGKVDRQTVVLLLNREYLAEQLLLNDNGRLQYDPGYDRFIYRGVVYRAAGDTLVSQSYNDPMLVDILLQREDLKTGDIIGDAVFP